MLKYLAKIDIVHVAYKGGGPAMTDLIAGQVQLQFSSIPGLEFRDGEVVSAHADQGEEYLTAALATDAGARFLGELGIGTNAGIDRATGHILLDEKIAGTVHLALGRSYPETGGTNQSALHWDLVCDLRGGGRLSADGAPVVQDGVVLA